MEKWYEFFRKVSSFYHKHQQKMVIAYNVTWNLFLLLLVIGLIGFSFIGGLGAGYFASLVKDEPIRSEKELEKDIYDYSETTKVYFADNVYLGKIRTDLEREKIKIDQISEHLKHAIVAVEDEYFYEHKGIVPKAIMRAIFQEFSNSSVRTGGSTLTQQLIKNQILTNEVSFERKAKEILLALRLEKYFTKDQILEAYLNVSSFGRNSSGRNIAGVQAAAQGIFGIDAKDLSIPQAAFIAGLPQNPFAYTPFTKDGEVKEDLQPGINRMKTVLRKMFAEGYITKKEYEEALKFDLKAHLAKKKKPDIEQYPWIIYEVEKRVKDILAEQLAKKDGHKLEDLRKNNKELFNRYMALADQDMRQNGYNIHTTINKKIYDKMQEVVKNYKYYGSPKLEKKKDPETGKTVTIEEPVEVGAVLIENKTGKIISFVGGRDHNREQTNHATRALRPNGSTMKPLAVYAPAMEMGIVQPGTVVADLPFSIGKYQPKNYGGGYHGLTSIRTALKHSYNIPAVKTYAKIISQNPVSYLEKMGFSSLAQEDYSSFSLALGAMTYGVTVEENVNAFATFANNGEFVDAYMIEKIETQDGKVIYQHNSKKEKVFSPQTAYLMIDMMRDVIQSGTASSLKRYLSFQSDWAGKTGTGQDYRDAWFVAVNPNVSFGTWIGYDTPKRLETTYKGLTYSNRNILLWAKLMNAAYSVKPDLIDPNTSFKMPKGIVSRSYCALSGDLPSELCKKAGLVQTDLYNAKFLPNKVDKSLAYGKFVLVDNVAYQVPANAPAEFVQEGPLLKKEVLNNLGISDVSQLTKLLPSGVNLEALTLTGNRVLQDNGKAPSKVPAVKLSGTTLSWSKSGEYDVIGYRVYAAPSNSNSFKKIASIPAKNNLSISVGKSPASYYVVAVDVAGKASPPSAIVKTAQSGKTEPQQKPKQTANARQ